VLFRSYQNNEQPPKNTDTIVHVQENQSFSPEVQCRVLYDDKRKKTMDVGEVYNDYLSINDNVTKKIECISNQLKCDDSQTDTESEEEE
jgi:hypothetical protein